MSLQDRTHDGEVQTWIHFYDLERGPEEDVLTFTETLWVWSRSHLETSTAAEL